MRMPTTTARDSRGCQNCGASEEPILLPPPPAFGIAW